VSWLRVAGLKSRAIRISGNKVGGN